MKKTDYMLGLDDGCRLGMQLIAKDVIAHWFGRPLPAGFQVLVDQLSREELRDMLLRLPIAQTLGDLLRLPKVSPGPAEAPHAAQ